MMVTRPLGSLPDLIERLQARGEAGAEILRRLAEADGMIAGADTPRGFTPVCERHKARLLATEGRRLLTQAISDATAILAELTNTPDPPQPGNTP